MNSFTKQIISFLITITCVINVECHIKNGNYKNLKAVGDDPDLYLTPTKIIRRHGYPSEAHVIQSADGYLLEYHRIPNGKIQKASTSKYPVLLHHGLLCSSVDWIINGPDKSLGYRLADAGYDVWLANARGNTYSRSHVELNPKSKEFWNFTFHEMGYYDIPAAIDYILNVTGKEKLLYIGHSLGTTTFFAFATSRPEYADKVLAQISLAPVGAIPNTRSIFKYLVPIAKQIRSMTDWYNNGAFLEHDFLTSIFCKAICGIHMFNVNVCEQMVIFKLFGKDKQQFNESLLPIILNNQPAGTSGKNMIHCAQLISSNGEFRNYDYGEAGNLEVYKSKVPPSYNISQIQIPIKMYYGKNDILADPKDVITLYQKLSKPLGLQVMAYDQWTHVDFLWAKDVNHYFLNDAIEYIANITGEPDFIRMEMNRAIQKRNDNSDNALSDELFPGEGNEFYNIVGTPKTFYGEVNEMMNDKINSVKASISNTTKQINNKFKTTMDSVKNEINNARNKVSSTMQNWQKSIEAAFHRTNST